MAFFIPPTPRLFRHLEMQGSRTLMPFRNRLLQIISPLRHSSHYLYTIPELSRVYNPETVEMDHSGIGSRTQEIRKIQEERARRGWIEGTGVAESMGK